MKPASAALLAAQQTNNRYPIGRMELYDTILRWSVINSAVFSGVTNPYTDDFRMDMCVNDTANPFVFAYLYNSSFVVRITVPEDDVNTFTDLTDGGQIVFTNNDYRVSAEGIDVWHISDGDIRKYNGVSNAFWKNIGAGDFNIAAVTSDVAYTLEFINGATASDISKLQLTHHTSSSSDVMDYQIYVDADYTMDDSWLFDAVRLDDETDVIVFNSNHNGNPKIVLRKNGVFGNTRDMIPIDIVDNYSYLRIGWMKVYNGVIYATGEMGRAGSTGLNAQSAAVVLRSRDGEHWTFDRYRYIGTTPFHVPMIMYNGYAYKIQGDNLYRAPLTPFFGLTSGVMTDDHIFIEIEDEILSYNISSSESGSQLSVSLSNYNNIFSDITSDKYIKPGYMVKVYGGYKDSSGDHELLLGTFGIDSIPSSLSSAENTMNFNAREWSYKLMNDMKFDQDWQWTSQILHYDDCNKMDHLYSVGGDGVKLKVTDRDSTITAKVSNDLISGDDALVSHNIDGKTIYVSTIPYEADDAFMEVTFSIVPNLEEQPGLYDIGKGYSLEDQVLGTGAGAALVEDEYNFIVAFLDVVTQQLVLLSSRGNNASTAWTEVAVNDASSIVDDNDLYAYSVYMNVVGNSVNYGIFLYKNIDLANQGYQGNLAFSDVVERHSEDRTGVITSSYVPYMNVKTIDQSGYDPDSLTNVIARSLTDFNDGKLVGINPNYTETSLYTWVDFSAGGGLAGKKIVIDDEVITVTNPVNISSRNRSITGLMEILWASEASDHTNNHEQTFFVDKTGWPIEAEDGDYWTGAGHAQYWVMHFTDGDMSGRFAQIQGCWDSSGNNMFVVLKNETYIRAHAGDHVIIGPAFEVNREATYQHTSDTRVNRYGYDLLGIKILSFSAVDLARPMSMDWLLKDIAYKAGLMYFSGSMASCSDDSQSESIESHDGGYEYQLGLHNNIVAEVTVTGANFGSGDEISPELIAILYVHDQPNYDDSTKTFMALLQNDGTDQLLYFSYNGVGFKTYAPSLKGGNKVTFVKDDNIIAVWLEDRFLGYCAFENIFRNDNSSYTDDNEGATYYTLYVNPNISGVSYSVNKYELDEIANEIFADQGSNAIEGMSKAIREARIKFLPNTTGRLKISKFVNRDNAGTIPDVIYNDAIGQTDNVSTHFRIVGEEISDYINHEYAALYGMQFQTVRAESLEEQAAYEEAIKISNDAISHSESRNQAIGAQLHYELEDKVNVNFSSVDGQIVNGDYVIHQTSLSFSRAAMVSSMYLRKYYEG